MGSLNFSNYIDIVQAIVTGITLVVAFFIGRRQNEINEKVGKLQDVVELYGAHFVEVYTDEGGKEFTKEYVGVQNVGTRIVYLESYTFNGRKYKLNGQVLPSTYSQALANYYKIQLPTNGETHVSITFRYKDVDGRLWESEVMGDLVQGWGWKIATYSKKLIKDNK